MSNKNKICYGIDFGTTNIRVSWIKPTDKSSLLKLTSENDYIKNTIYYKNDRTEIGVNFPNLIDNSNKNTINNIKKKLLKKDYLIEIPNLNASKNAGDIVKDTFSEISKIIKNKKPNDEIGKVVVTVPVIYSEVQKQIIKNAVEDSGFEVDSIITEPVASTIYFAENIESNEESKLLVIDFGGGTIDFCLSEIHKDDENKELSIEVVATSGNNIGGVDIDKWIFEKYGKEKLISELKNSDIEYNGLTEKDELFVTDFMIEKIRKMKETIFDSNEAEAEELINFHDTDLSISLDNEKLGKVHFDMTLSKEDIITVLKNKEIKESIEECLENLINDANYDKSDLEKINIALIGGSSRIDFYKDIIDEYFEESSPEYLGDEDDEDDILNSVTFGACKKLILNNNKNGYTINMVNKASYILGIDDGEGMFKKVLDKPSISMSSAMQEINGTSCSIYQVPSGSKTKRKKINDTIFTGSIKINKEDFKGVPMMKLGTNRSGDIIYKLFDYVQYEYRDIAEEKFIITT